LFNLVLFIAVIPDLMVYFKALIEGKGKDMMNYMDSIPMGEMMNKMMKKMGLSKDKEAESK
jgi:hypothetical protein